MPDARYLGRFAPSPTGPLHAGSLVAALASWLDARAHGGRWLVRIEDVDPARSRDGAAERILGQLAACGLPPDAPPVYQSSRNRWYERAAMQLVGRGQAYPCACSRRDIASAGVASGQVRARGGEWVYPGTCRAGLRRKPARALRLRLDDDAAEASTACAAPVPPRPVTVLWDDRRLGLQRQDLTAEVGDFVLRRADGCWAYQLAVVVDDAAQGVTDVVRGEDLADNTPRQIRLQRLLGLPTPRYLHTPLVLGADGDKLSKQNGAAALDLSDPLQALQRAGAVLGIRLGAVGTPADWLAAAVAAWHDGPGPANARTSPPASVFPSASTDGRTLA